MLSSISGMLSREKVAKAATELAEHLQIIENIRALQAGQKALADEIRAINERATELQTEIRALKSETKFECLKETQSIVNAVQGGFNQRLETLSNKIAVMEASFSSIIPPGHDRSGYAQLASPEKVITRRKIAVRKS